MNNEHADELKLLNDSWTDELGPTGNKIAVEAIGKANLAGDIMQHAGLPNVVIQAAQGQLIADITVERLRIPANYGKMWKE